MRVTDAQSPNCNDRPRGCEVSVIVLHADASTKASASVSWIRSATSKVSYHALVDRDGSVFTFVPTGKRAWHAGKSSYGGRENVNDFSLGLAFANDNRGEAYTDSQYQVAALLCVEWMKLFPRITPERITTHAAIAPGRKTDPLGFDMARFRALVEGIRENRAA